MAFVYKSKWIVVIGLLFSSVGLSWAKEPSSVNNRFPKVFVTEQIHNLGVIEKGMDFGWAFLLENKGDGDLKLLKAYSSIPGEIKIDKPLVIHPGEADHVYIGLESSQIQGKNTLEVIIQTNDPQNPEVLLTVNGYVQWPVEILPLPVALMKIQKGQSAEKQFILVNHTSTEMNIEKIEFDEALLHVSVREIEKGKQFEIKIISKTDAPLGEHRNKIIFRTNVPESPTVSMVSWLNVLGRIYTNVQELDFESLSLEDIQNPDVVQWTNELVLINGMSTPGFKVMKAECNIDFLKVEIDPVSKNNVYRVDVFFNSPKAKKGEFKGSLKISTNDHEFKEIILPVHGMIR